MPRRRFFFTRTLTVPIVVDDVIFKPNTIYLRGHISFARMTRGFAGTSYFNVLHVVYIYIYMYV